MRKHALPLRLVHINTSSTNFAAPQLPPLVGAIHELPNKANGQAKITIARHQVPLSIDQVTKQNFNRITHY
jgi:hypothetical protein